MAQVAPPRQAKGETLRDNSNKKDVRILNIESAKAVADAVRTSLGPRGMDKMVSRAKTGEVVIHLSQTVHSNTACLS